MNVYLRGVPVTLLQRFFLIDALSGQETPADPTTVTFTLLAPDDTETTFVFGTDANVTNPEVGVYLCALDPPLPPGEFRWRCEGDGDVVASFEGAFTVLESGVLPPDPSGVATPGPCSSWINGDDVAACGPNLGLGSETWRLDDVAYDASYLLYELSGRQFPGVCERTVRPCRQSCSCFGGPTSLGLGPWYWNVGALWPGVGWRDECGNSCGCGTESYVRLAGYPVREILEVKIDGAVLASGEYRLDQRRNLIRLADATADPPTDRFWPACQNLALDDDQPGTYSVRYSWGADVPSLGRSAAAQLARELWSACSGSECKLPSRVTKIVRQGITIDRVAAAADALRAGASGLSLVDAFIAAVNPSKARRRSLVWSPDQQPFARKVGQ